MVRLQQRFAGDARPSEGLLAGLLVFAAAAGCAPLIAGHYGHSQQAKRAASIAAASGLLIALLRPPLPLRVDVFVVMTSA